MSDTDLDKLEAENADLVTRFCKAWEERNAEDLLPYLSDDIHYTMWDDEGAIECKGKEEFMSVVGPFLESIPKIEFEILRTQVMGKIVMNERVDRFIRNDPEINDWIFSITGVFCVEDGKIVYWKDYRVPGKLNQM